MRISYTSRIMQAILLVVVLLAFIGNTVSAKAEINSIEASLFSQNDIADNTIENLNSFHLLAFSELAYRDWEKGQTVYENLKDDWDKPAFSPNSIASELSTIQKDYSYGNLFVSNTKGTILYKELCKDISDWVVVGTSKFPPKQLSMYQYHPGFYAVTFQGQTPNGQKTVIAFRGSTAQNKDDTINDWLENDFPFQLTHLYTDQLSLAQWYYEVCISDLEINCDDIVVTGHSLGGALATAVSMVNGVHAEVFNSASVYEALTINHPELVASHFSGVDKWNLLSHIVIGDVVSNWNNEYTHLPYVEHRLSDNSITKAHNLSTFLRYIDNGGSKGVTFLVSSPVSASPTPTAANPNDLPLFLGTSGNDDVVVYKPASSPYNSKAVILGGDGDDTLVSACDSDDMLFGGNAANYDFLDGGKGNDKYFYYKGNGIHIIQNESGHDSVFLFDFSETDLIEFVSDESFDVVACNGMPIIYVAGTRNSKSSVDVVLVQKTFWGQEEYTLVELKKSSYRFTQPNMTLEALTHSIRTGKENTFVTEKRLTQADGKVDEDRNKASDELGGNNSPLLSLYVPKAIRAKEQTMQLDHMNDDIVNKLTYGLLMDWDNDGTKELFLSYLQPHSWYGTRKVGLYDIQSGEVTVITEDLNTGVDYGAAGIYGFTGITMFRDTPAIFACEYGEYTSSSPEDAYLTTGVSFTLWNIHSQRVLHEAVISCDGNHLSYVIDDTACSEADFYALIDACSFLSYDSAPPTVRLYYDAELVSVDELINAMQKNAVQSDTVENIPAKQPAQIRRIEESGDVFTVSLQFDSDGRLVSSKNSSGYFETYTYDEADRLIVVDNSVFGPMHEYHYDENGYLVEISGSGEGGAANLSIENDQNGRMIREISDSDFGTVVTEYTYNEDGSHVDAVITSTSEYSPPIEYASYEYEFDNQGRILAVTFTGESYSYCVTYDYDHPPFTLICDENGIPYRCEITDCTGRKIWSMELWPILQPIEYDEDGYISRIVSEGAIYEFYYSQP